MLDRKSFFIREHTGLLKLTDTYDILDPETQDQIGLAREEVSGLVKAMRLLISKRLMSTEIKVYSGTADQLGPLQFSIKRNANLFRSKVSVLDPNGGELGYFKAKAFSIGGTFSVRTPDDEEVALIKGNWKGWTFKFLAGEKELGVITKKWAGLGKEMFTSADNYIIDITEDVNPAITTLFLAGGLAIDTVFKEK